MLLGAATACLAAVTATGWLGRFWWVADLFNHFALYYTVASGSLLLLAAILGRRRTAVILLMILAFNARAVWPTFLPVNHKIPSGASAIRLAQVNILHKNRDRDRALAFLERCDADVLFVQELDPWWARVIAESDVPYRFEVTRPAEGSFGIAMLVRETLDRDHVTIESTRVIDFANHHDGAERPAIEVALLLDGQAVKLLSIHPPPPTTAGYADLRNAILQQAREWADVQTDPHVILGDLNTTPWSYAFAILTRDGELINSLNGQGNQGSWPTHLPLPWLLPIDHCLFSPQWVCTERRLGPETGSDHLPLLVTLALKPQAPAMTTADDPPISPRDLADISR